MTSNMYRVGGKRKIHLHFFSKWKKKKLEWIGRRRFEWLRKFILFPMPINRFRFVVCVCVCVALSFGSFFRALWREEEWGNLSMFVISSIIFLGSDFFSTYVLSHFFSFRRCRRHLLFLLLRFTLVFMWRTVQWMNFTPNIFISLSSSWS